MIIMRHFRSFRGSRRSSGRVSGSTRSVKYIMKQAGATEAAGLIAVSLAIGTDNTTLGQSSVGDINVPVGSKIVKFDIFMPKVNLGAATANFVVWTLQHIRSGQAVLNPLLVGGSPIRNNVMLTGVIGMGAGQNSSLHIKYNVPKGFQRVHDGDVWSLVMDNGLAVSTFYYCIYKVHQ